MSDPKTFVGKVDYKVVFADFASRGIVLSPEEEEDFKARAEKDLKDHDRGALGGDMTSIFQGGLFGIFALLQNLFSGNFDFSNFGSSLSKSFSVTGDEAALDKLQYATIALNKDLKNSGNAKFVAIADLATGQSLGGKPEVDQNMIYEQLRRGIDLPGNISTSLDNNGVGAQMSNIVASQPPGKAKTPSIG